MAVYATQGLPILALTANVAAGPTYLRESSELVETAMVEHPGTLGRGSGPSSPPPPPSVFFVWRITKEICMRKRMIAPPDARLSCMGCLESRVEQLSRWENDRAARGQARSRPSPGARTSRPGRTRTRAPSACCR
jgi:hypothetical protein